MIKPNQFIFITNFYESLRASLRCTYLPTYVARLLCNYDNFYSYFLLFQTLNGQSKKKSNKLLKCHREVMNMLVDFSLKNCLYRRTFT